MAETGVRNQTGLPLGPYLRSARQAAGMSLRDVEEASNRRVKNGYLSQVENGQITKPSVENLWELAEVYKADYDTLLLLAGYRLPKPTINRKATAAAQIPLRALEDLGEDDLAAVMQFIAFLKHRQHSPEIARVT